MLPIWVYETCLYPLHMVKCLDKQHESKKILLNIFVKRLSSITKRERFKALVWFWLIDETYWTNPMPKCVDKLGWSNPSDEARW